MNDDLAAAAERLAAILAAENAALRRADFAAAVAMVPAKEAAMADLVRQPKPPIAAPALFRQAQRLRDLAAENQSLLARAITVQTRILRIVARAGAPPQAPRYGTTGLRVPSRRTAALALSTRA
jgi:hypothetical protein